MRKALVLFICCCAVATLRGANNSEFSAWFVDSLIKVFPDTPAGADSSEFAVMSARNGHASLQVAVRGASERKLHLRIIAPQLDGVTLPVSIYRVGMVNVASHPKDTPLEEVIRPDVGPYPDPLFPITDEISLKTSRTETLWISVFTPETAKPGIYRGAIELQGAKQSVRLPFRVEVFAATVPREQKLWVTHWLWMERETLEKHYPQLKSDPDRYWRILENTGRAMAAYKQNVAFIPVRALAKAKLADGKIQYDFGDFDRWVAAFDKSGMARRIEGGHLVSRKGGGYDSPLVLPSDFIENGAVVRKELPNDDPRAEQNLREFLRQLRRHLQEKGWLDRYMQHVHDEPHGSEMPVYRRLVHIVSEELPGTPTIDAISLAENIPDQQETTVWVPLLSTFDEKLALIAEHQSHGGQGWYYICLAPTGKYLNRFIDYPTLKVRLLPWVNYRYGLTGYLHWGGNFWTDKPLENVQPLWGKDFYLPAGDDAIVYPDPEHDGVFVSLRLEMMREGIEDYELLMQAAQKNRGDADALVKIAVPGFTDYVRDVEKFRKLQRQLLTIASQSN